jgi:ABC-type glycerol-3-phosphate transport system substrate-binding protein
MKPARRALAWMAACACLAAIGAQALTSCSALPGWLPSFRPTLTPSPQAAPSATPAADLATVPAPVNTPEMPGEMTIWLPPEFNPAGQSKAAALLQQRLDAFSQAHNIQINVRLKASSGAGGLIESLTAASAAAPTALPALTALSRTDLETAAIKGLLTPLEGSSFVLEDNDWYEYARQLARVQGASFGLPFAGDALLLVYRPALVSPSPASWDNILSQKQPLVFPAASPQALTTIALYQSAGGAIEDAQGRPVLDETILTSVFELYAQAVKEGVFPAAVTQTEVDDQVWQVYSQGQANMAIAWSTSYLTNLPADSAALPMPAASGGSYSLATGWVWAVTDPLPERRQLSIRLGEWLTDPAFLGAWSEAAGYLPTRPSALETWRNGSLRAVINQVALSAHARPSNDLLFSLGPVLRDAALTVIHQDASAGAAAESASTRVASPPPP